MRTVSVAGPAATQLYQNHTSNPGMATAGSGDVLSGVIAGLCAQGLEPFAATCAGVYLHGVAGDLEAAVHAAMNVIEPVLEARDTEILRLRGLMAGKLPRR